MKPKFCFYEIVTVKNPQEKIKHLLDLEGAILGRANGEDGSWNYSVHIYSLGESWYLEEHELVSTNRFDNRENFYDGTEVRVVVDRETGDGRLAD